MMTTHEIKPEDNLSKDEWAHLVKYYLHAAIRLIERGAYNSAKENIGYAQMRLETVLEIEDEETRDD